MDPPGDTIYMNKAVFLDLRAPEFANTPLEKNISINIPKTAVKGSGSATFPNCYWDLLYLLFDVWIIFDPSTVDYNCILWIRPMKFNHMSLSVKTLKAAAALVILWNHVTFCFAERIFVSSAPDPMGPPINNLKNLLNIPPGNNFINFSLLLAIVPKVRPVGS